MTLVLVYLSSSWPDIGGLELMSLVSDRAKWAHHGLVLVSAYENHDAPQRVPHRKYWLIFAIWLR